MAVAYGRCSVLMVVVLCFGGGCSPMSMAKRGYTELKGASGKVVPVRQASPGFYRSIGSLNVTEVSNSIGPVCPASAHALISAATKTHAAAAGERLSGGEACTAEVSITYFQPPRGVGVLIGKGAILLGRTRLIDPQQQTRADLIVGVFSKAVRTTDEEMAEVFGRTLAEYVVKQAN